MVFQHNPFLDLVDIRLAVHQLMDLVDSGDGLPSISSTRISCIRALVH